MSERGEQYCFRDIEKKISFVCEGECESFTEELTKSLD